MSNLKELKNRITSVKSTQRITSAMKMVSAAKLKKEKCDLIICLSHLGFEYLDDQIVSDRILARNSSNIDIILGGHTHTFLDKPVVENNKEKKNVLINQVGWAGIQLGRIDIDLNSVKLGSENLIIH